MAARSEEVDEDESLDQSCCSLPPPPLVAVIDQLLPPLAESLVFDERMTLTAPLPLLAGIHVFSSSWLPLDETAAAAEDAEEVVKPAP